MKKLTCCVGLAAMMLIFDTPAYAQQNQSIQRIRPQTRLLRAGFRVFVDRNEGRLTRDDVFELERNVLLDNERLDVEQCSSEVILGGVNLEDTGFQPTRISITTVIFDTEILVACR